MKNIQLWITVAVLSAAVICWGLWIMFRPHATAQSSESLQGILMEHVEYLPEVYRAHQNHTKNLNEDTCSIVIYRYSPFMCVSCYVDDISDLKIFQKKIGQERVLVLPAYPNEERENRIKLNSEMEGFRYMNIPANLLNFPANEEDNAMRYFAVINPKGQVSMVFFPVSGRRDLTQRYFQEVARYFKELKMEN